MNATDPRLQIESLKLENVSFSFSGREPLLVNVSLELPTNKIVWISGSSGSGKSVFLKLLNGLLMPSHGSILLNEQSIQEMSFEEFLPYRLQMGYSFDFGGLINNRTIYQNLSLPLEYHQQRGRVDIGVRVHDFLTLFNLESVSGERPSSIPGAFRKAACVARAFMLDPQVLLLDDPTTGLRPELRQRLKELLVQKRKSGDSHHIFVATDDAAFIKDIADEHLIIKDKTITREVTAKAVA